MIDFDKCSKCNSTNVVLVQYRDTPEDYDGWSESRCLDCGLRIGRWSGKELKEGELESKYNRFKEENK